MDETTTTIATTSNNYIGTGRHLLSISNDDSDYNHHQDYLSSCSYYPHNCYSSPFYGPYDSSMMIVDYGIRFINQTITNLAESVVGKLF